MAKQKRIEDGLCIGGDHPGKVFGRIFKEYSGKHPGQLPQAEVSALAGAWLRIPFAEWPLPEIAGGTCRDIAGILAEAVEGKGYVDAGALATLKAGAEACSKHLKGLVKEQKQTGRWSPMSFDYLANCSAVESGDAALMRQAVSIVKSIERGRPDDVCTLDVAVSEFKVTKKTIRRNVKDGKLNDYREADRKGNSPIFVSRRELAQHWPRKSK